MTNYMTPEEIQKLRDVYTHLRENDQVDSRHAQALLEGPPPYDDQIGHHLAMNTLPQTDYRDTDRFCLIDFKQMPNENLARIADLLSAALEDAGIHISYVNILNINPESEDYNPDRSVGKFRITKKP